jgi:LacI family transcriptional regulator
MPRRVTTSTVHPPPGRPTLDDVAARCGLSKATVSRALHVEPGQTSVSPLTRRKVLRAAQQLGYRLNWRAQAFRQGKTYCIGLLYEEALPLERAVRALAETVRPRGYHILNVPVGPADKPLEDMLLDQRVDACVAYNGLPPAARALHLERRVPLVLMNLLTDLPVPHVHPDDRDGTAQVTRHLLELGHRNLVFYVNTADAGTPPHYSVAHRRETFEQLTAGAGLRARCVAGPVGELMDLIASAAGRGDRPTAVLAYSDIEAADVLKACWERGIRVPDELSVACFNDINWVDRLIPPLTTVSIPFDEIGRVGGELLLRQLDAPAAGTGTGSAAAAAAAKLARVAGTDAARVVVLPEQLVVRRSTAPPRRSVG